MVLVRIGSADNPFSIVLERHLFAYMQECQYDFVFNANSYRRSNSISAASTAPNPSRLSAALTTHEGTLLAENFRNLGFTRIRDHKLNTFSALQVHPKFK